MSSDIIAHSLPFITGMGFRVLCNFTYDEFKKDDLKNIFDGCKIFVKTDLIREFYNTYSRLPPKYIFIYTHNSDLPITGAYKYILDNEYILGWKGQNIQFKHPKLKSIPIGIANKRWNHGNIDILNKIINEKNVKNNLVHCRFSVHTNPTERNKCLSCIEPYKNQPRVDFETHLRELSQSYFSISPNGNGIDCHKHWESLYLGCIPIVTKSINIEFYSELPFLVIDKWEDFHKLELSEELYKTIWNDFDNNRLDINNYL